MSLRGWVGNGVLGDWIDRVGHHDTSVGRQDFGLYFIIIASVGLYEYYLLEYPTTDGTKRAGSATRWSSQAVSSPIMSTPAASGKAPAASGKRKRPAAGASSASTEAAEQKIIEICTRNSGAARQDTLEEQMRSTFSQDSIVMALNALLSKQRLVPSMQNNKLVYKLQSSEEAQKLIGLTAEDRLILQEVEKAGDVGISAKELRGRANMQHPQVTKVLKKLETRVLIKQVKSVTSKNKKVFMLCGIEPARELTGGSWYNGGEFDYELITVLQKASIAFIQQREKATASEVCEFIRTSGLIKGKPLRLQDIESVLNSLVYDARIEVTPLPHGSSKSDPVYNLVHRMPRLDAMVECLTTLPQASCECTRCFTGSGPECPMTTAWLAQVDVVTYR